MENLNESPIKHLAFTSLLIITLAFLDMPYGFYTFLRIFLFITSIFYLYNTPKDKPLFLLSWLICAIIYNPIIPLEFDRHEWEIINIATLGYFIVYLFNHNLTPKRKEKIVKSLIEWFSFILVMAILFTILYFYEEYLK